MADTFDPDAYLAEENFDPDAYLNDDTEAPLDESMGQAQAALQGVSQGATFGFGDEIAGGFEAAGRALGLEGVGGPITDIGIAGDEWDPTLSKEQLLQSYRKGLEAERGRNVQAQEEHPGTYMSGTLAGGVAGPGKFAKAYKYAKGLGTVGKAAVTGGIGAGTGAVAGFGMGEGGIENRIESSKEGATIGAVTGPLVPLVGSGIKAAKGVGSKIKSIPVIEDMIESFKRGKKGEVLATSAGRREAADLVSKKGGELFEDIKGLQDKVGGGIQKEIQKATESGAKVDLTDEIKEATKQLKEIKTHGTLETSSYASGIEAEINKLKGPKAKDIFAGIAKKDLPEGLVLPKESAKKVLVTPEQAREFELAIKAFRPQFGMSPLVTKPAGTARELYKGVGEKLADITEGMPELKKNYGLIKNTLSRLKVNEKNLPEQTKDKITKVLSKLEGENLTGDEARRIVTDVVENVRQISPNIAAKYEKDLVDVVSRLDLSEKIIKGGSTFTLLGTPRAVATAGSNVSGLAMNKLMNAPPETIQNIAGNLARMGSKGISLSGKLMKAADSPEGLKGLVIGTLNDPVNAKLIEEASKANQTESVVKEAPYKTHQRAFKSAEKASPEELSSQAQSIREEYGEQGDKLATLLDNMSQKDIKGRRAAMFHILQNPQYRRMMKLVK
jgi:polyhydroxyalkanoate synthesis regulator phasin